jgi:hypothetical protein
MRFCFLESFCVTAQAANHNQAVIGTDIQEEDGFAEAVVTIWKGRTRHW